MSNLLVRTLVALIAIPLIILLLYFGGIYLYVALLLLSLGIISEYFSFCQADIPIANKFVIYFSSIFCTVLFAFNKAEYVPLVLILGMITYMSFELKNDISGTIRRLGNGFFILFYSSCGPICFSLIRAKSFHLALYALLFVWSVDTFAYFAGRLFGKHKMSPVLSPNKTIEGLFGGIIGAVALGIIFNLFVTNEISLFLALIIGIFGALLTQAGDLIESKIKREVGIKDSGKLIPGHGGLLDRFDSFLFVTPVMFLIFEYLIPLIN